jgi:osomolarity two-component system sensor histidine kinase NIK1
LDGYGATRILREAEQKNGTKRLPIIGVSAHVMAESIEKCFESGMDDYIGKPFEPEELKRKISALVQGGVP